MPLKWREAHYGETQPGGPRFDVKSQNGKFRAKDPGGTTLGEFDNLAAAKQACEDAYKALESQSAAPQPPTPPAPQKPASEPPRPAAGHPASTRGKR